MTEVKPTATSTTWRDVPHKTDKVALVGFASSTRDLAPYTDESFEIWVLNDLGRQVSRWTRLFEMHSKQHLCGDWDRGNQVIHGPDHWVYMSKCPGPGPKWSPIYMQQHYDEIPASVALPVKELEAALYTNDEGCYFTSTPAYMMALAMLEGFKEIHCYGIDLLQEQEYAYERPCMEYLIGLARGKGITVKIPRQSALCKAGFVYGFSDLPQAEPLDKLHTFIEQQLPKFEEAAKRGQGEFSGTHAQIAALDSLGKWLTKTLEEKQTPADARKAILDEWTQYYDMQRRAIIDRQLNIVRHMGIAEGTVVTGKSVQTWLGHLKRGGELKA